MPSGTATKPGDIVTSMSGQTIEILNTDAKVALFCAMRSLTRLNSIRYRNRHCDSDWCMRHRLGHVASGLFANEDKLAQELLAAGEQSTTRLATASVGRLPTANRQQLR